MGAGYHPGTPYCGAQEEYHVGPGLSQKVYDERHQAFWATKTKKGNQLLPYDQVKHAIGKARKTKFKNYTGEFRDAKGNVLFIPKEMPKHLLSHKEHGDYQRYIKGLPPHPAGQQPQGQKNSKKKTKKQNKLTNNHFIKLLDALKAGVSKGNQDNFPAQDELGNSGMTAALVEYTKLMTDYKNSRGEFFTGRNVKQVWPKDLEEFENFKSIYLEDSGSGKYIKFNHLISNAKRGIAHIILSTNRYKAAKKQEGDLAESIAKANGLTGSKDLDDVRRQLENKTKLALHSPAHIFAVLPGQLASRVKLGDTVLDGVGFVTNGNVVDDKTLALLLKDDLKILKDVMKRVKRTLRSKDVVPTAPQRSRAQFPTEGLVGMGQVY